MFSRLIIRFCGKRKGVKVRGMRSQLALFYNNVLGESIPMMSRSRYDVSTDKSETFWLGTGVGVE